MSVGATFGKRDVGQPGALTKIYDVTKEGDNVNYDNVTFAPGSNYIVLRTAWTISTGKFYGQALFLVTTPSEEAFASDVPANTAFGGLGTAGITASYQAGGRLQWRCSSAAYRARVRVYKIN